MATEFADCPECGAGVSLVTNPTKCYKCGTAIYRRNPDPEPAEAPASEHYQRLPVQPIELTRHMGFLDGNVVKYVARFREKNGLEDLHKAQFYLEQLIAKEYPNGEDD